MIDGMVFHECGSGHVDLGRVQVVKDHSPAQGGSLSCNPGDIPDGLLSGLIETDRFAVGGALLTWCCATGGRCVLRTGSEHVIAILDSKQCKWCNVASYPQHSGFDEARTLAYLRGMFDLTLSDTVRLSELISELTSTQWQTEANSIPFTGTPPYCTVDNVTHISSKALSLLSKFDSEFIWGHNLIFNTRLGLGSSGLCKVSNTGEGSGS